MSLDISLTEIKEIEVYSANITHNLGKMADAAGIYHCLWRPEEINIKTAGELIDPLKEGLKKLEDDPEYYKKFNPPNGWGTYKGFIFWLKKLIIKCENHPNATIKA